MNRTASHLDIVIVNVLCRVRGRGSTRSCEEFIDNTIVIHNMVVRNLSRRKRSIDTSVSCALRFDAVYGNCDVLCICRLAANNVTIGNGGEVWPRLILLNLHIVACGGIGNIRARLICIERNIMCIRRRCVEREPASCGEAERYIERQSLPILQSCHHSSSS